MACIINKKDGRTISETLVESRPEFLDDEVRVRRHVNSFYDGGMVIDLVDTKTGDVIHSIYFTTHEAGFIQGILE